MATKSNSDNPFLCEFIEEMIKPVIDYDKCRSLINQGVDINYSDASDGNLLKIILDKKESELGKEELATLLHFFLDNGFDPGAHDGRYGAECLQSLCNLFLGKAMVSAAKILIRAGAIDKGITDQETGINYTAYNDLEFMQEVCYQLKDYVRANYCEAYIQLLNELVNGNTDSDIDVYDYAMDKRINHVFAIKPNRGGVFINAEDYDNSFISTLYFEYDDGFLAIDRYASIWTSDKLPSGSVEDISMYFKDILGRKIKEILFSKVEIEEGFAHPETIIVFDSGRQLHITTNYGETNDEVDMRAHYNIVF